MTPIGLNIITGHHQFRAEFMIGRKIIRELTPIFLWILLKNVCRIIVSNLSPA
jgi:hypothetical protein